MPSFSVITINNAMPVGYISPLAVAGYLNVRRLMIVGQRILNRIGVALISIAAGVLLVGLAWRASGVGTFALAAIWTISPYVILFVVHRRWSHKTPQAIVALVVSILVVVFGMWLTVEALFLNFGPIGAGVAMSSAPLYQLPVAIAGLVVCSFIERRGQLQPSNPTIERDAPQAGRPSL